VTSPADGREPAGEREPAGDGAGPTPHDAPTGSDDGSATDAWMAAFAPADDGAAGDPIAVGVLREGDHQGGETAAPVAATVLAAALR
jgi:cell division protein FtsI/penicillin-binding protein 2